MGSSKTKEQKEQKQERTFSMHRNLLRHVIESQAGSLAKAVLEGVMNSVDAGATRCDITLNETALVIADDGKGFADLREVEECFEVFGAPHEEGDAFYGRFRLGRGQLFCYGANRWRSTCFIMDVDIRNRGLQYDLVSNAPRVKGCTITVTLYERHAPSEVDRTTREVREFVRYAPIAVTLNGQQLNVDPATEEWDVDDNDALVRFRVNGPVMIYNRGVLAERHSHYNLGTSAIVVSKHPLKLNMARNQVDSSCPIWKRIRDRLRAHGGKQARKPNKRITEAEQQLLAEQFLTGSLAAEEYRSAKIFTDVRGRHHGLATLLASDRPITAAERGDQVAEKAHQQSIAFVLATETLERFNVADVPALMQLLEATIRNHDSRYTANRIAKHPTTTREALDQIVDSKYTPVADRDLNPLQRACLSAIRRAGTVLYRGIVKAGVIAPGEQRAVNAGVSAAADGWTDGHAQIWIERAHLTKLTKGFAGALWLMNLLVHEYCHSTADAGSHQHDLDFYETYHELTLGDFIAEAAEKALRSLTHALACRNLDKTTRAVLRSLDHEALLNRSAERAKQLAIDAAEAKADAEAERNSTPSPELVESGRKVARSSARKKRQPA